MTIFLHKIVIIWNLVVNSHRATLVAQVTMTKQGLAVVYERVPLLIIQVLQFVYVILAFRLALSRVDIRQNLLDDCDLRNSKKDLSLVLGMRYKLFLIRLNR